MKSKTIKAKQETVGEWLKKQKVETRVEFQCGASFKLYSKRVKEINSELNAVDQVIGLLQLQREAMRNPMQEHEELREKIKRYGEKKLAYDVHFVDPNYVQKIIKGFKEKRSVTREEFFEISDKIDELRELKKNLVKRKKAVRSVLESY